MKTRKNFGLKVRFLVIDGFPLRRAGIVDLLRRVARSAEVISLASVTELHEDLTEEEPTFRLVILSLGGIAVSEPAAQGALRELHDTLGDVRLVILSDRDEVREVLAAFRAGAHGFLPTSLEPEVAAMALELVIAGGMFYPSSILAELATMPRQSAAAPPEDINPLLTARQQEVLSLLREGKSNKVIARELDMQESTVKVHIRQILRKLGVANRTQAALSAATRLKPDSVTGREPDSPQQAQAHDIIRLVSHRS